MKLKSLYNAVLTDFLKNNSKYRYGKINIDDLGHYFITDGYVAWIVPDEKFPFDFDKIKGKSGGFSESSIKRIIDSKDTVEGFMTNDLKDIKGKTYVKFTDASKEKEVWVNKDFLKYFENPFYRVSGEIDPVLVYDYDILVGVVLPMRVSKEE